MYESTGSQTFRTTAGIQPVPDVLQEGYKLPSDLESYQNIMHFHISSRKKAGKKIPNHLE